MPDAINLDVPVHIVRWRDVVLHVRLHGRLRDGDTTVDVPVDSDFVETIDDGSPTPRFVIRRVSSR